MNLRNGKFSFSEIFAFTDEYQKQFEKAAQNTELPAEPAMKKIEDLIMSFYEASV
jgi:hypothetical protein